MNHWYSLNSGDKGAVFFVSHPFIGLEPYGRAGAKKKNMRLSPKKKKSVSGRFRTRYLTIHRAALYRLDHSGWLLLTAAWWTVWSWCCTRTKEKQSVSGGFRTRYLTIHRAALYHLDHSGWLLLTAAWWTVWSWRNFLGGEKFSSGSKRHASR